MPLFPRFICKSIARVEDAQVVDVLDVALLEVQRGTVFIGSKVQGVQCFCLSFCDRWNILRSWLGQKAREVPASVLYDDTLGC